MKENHLIQKPDMAATLSITGDNTETRHKKRWVLVTIAMFNDPKNPRSPANWYTMEKFAYLTATLALDTEPLVMEEKKMPLRYGVAVWDGETSAEEVEAAVMGGEIILTDGPSFECPVIPVPRGRH